MGQYDSSRTRVAPVFDRLLAIDPTGRSWLPALLGLVAKPLVTKPQPPKSDLQEALWWPCEKRLVAPCSLLHWLIKNLEEPTSGNWGSTATREKRERLVAKDAETIDQAVGLLRAGTADKGQHILEGPSCPDVFLSTPDMVIVIKGKRTERGPTTATTWIKMCHQTLRHLDGALEILGLGSSIVEPRQVEAIEMDKAWPIIFELSVLAIQRCVWLFLVWPFLLVISVRQTMEASAFK